MFLFAFALRGANAPAADATAALDEHLKPLLPLLGKTWKGEFKDSTPEKPNFDVMRWERILNGKAIRVLHSINHGDYGGETIIVWDEKKHSLAYHYFTTAGFTTTGTMELKDGKFVSHELVTNNSNGITEVKATSELRNDGSFHNKSEYLKEGKWVPGHEATYRVDAKAEVIFK
ncbi:MAG: hypothetical protein HY043_15180 [Verrucomicrobia bacterium]|nr:hypothetical protein [Verrucomicrobiota bacterium]